jgi:hypothetical protein
VLAYLFQRFGDLCFSGGRADGWDLLRGGARPGDIYKGYTVCEYLIHGVHSVSESLRSLFRVYYRDSCKEICRMFIEAGADLDVCCLRDPGIWDVVSHEDVADDDGRYVLGRRIPERVEHVQRGKPIVDGKENETSGEAGEEEKCLEEVHGLIAVLKDCFRDGTDELLGLIQKRKALVNQSAQLKSSKKRRRRRIAMTGV